MDRYEKTFSRLKKNRQIGFCPFAVLGDPNERTCLRRIKIYLKNADFLELGIPFSDPIADGPVIQSSSERALSSGATPKKCMRLIARIRSLTDIPIGILTYSNIIFRYGINKFYRDIKRAGADSILVADVPLEEISRFADAAKKHHIHQIFLASEYTDASRLKRIEKITGAFLYVVSVLGVTGSRNSLHKNVGHLLTRLRKNTTLPLVVGFGISTPGHIKTLKNLGADAAIVGSILVKTPLEQLESQLRIISASDARSATPAPLQ